MRDEINLCSYSSVLYHLSLSCTHPHRLLSSHQGKISTVNAKKWRGTDGIRVIETTYNSSHNFPNFLLIPISHLSPWFAKYSSICTPRVHAQLHPLSACIIPASSMPSRLTVLAKEALAQWKPHSATQSQPRGGKKKGGGKRRRRLWCFFSPPTWNHTLISAVLFLALHTLSWIYQRLLPKDFGSMLKCKIPEQLKHAFVRAWSFAPQAAIFHFRNYFSLSSFLSSHSPTAPPPCPTLAHHTTPAPGSVAECQSCKLDS